MYKTAKKNDIQFTTVTTSLVYLMKATYHTRNTLHEAPIHAI